MKTIIQKKLGWNQKKILALPTAANIDTMALSCLEKMKNVGSANKAAHLLKKFEVKTSMA